MDNKYTSIYIDGADPAETAEAAKLIGKVDGQTTNPTLVSKNPEVSKYLAHGKKLSSAEALNEYKKIVISIARVTKGPISIQVIADNTSSKEEMLRQANVYKDWIPNGVVKFPVTSAGLAAAEEFCRIGPVNLTLNFSQEQAAAVFAATKNAIHRVFISPFIGRLDDRGENGMQLVVNELRMYRGSDQHVEVLTASLRKLDHLLYAIQLKSPVVTSPFKIIKEWADAGLELPGSGYIYDPGALKPIPYRQIPLDRDWRTYDLHHDLTDSGLEKFMSDWHNLLK